MNIAIGAALIIAAGAVWLPEWRPEWLAALAGSVKANWPLLLAAGVAASMFAGPSNRRRPRRRTHAARRPEGARIVVRHLP